MQQPVDMIDYWRKDYPDNAEQSFTFHVLPVLLGNTGEVFMSTLSDI